MWAVLFAGLMICGPALSSPSTNDTKAAVDVASIEADVLSVWVAFVAALRANDATQAVSFFRPGAQERYLSAFLDLGDDLRTMPDGWSELQFDFVADGIVSASMADTFDGETELVFVSFVEMPDGR